MSTAEQNALTVHNGGTAPAPKAPLMAGASPKAIVPVDFEGAYRIAKVVHAAGMAPASLKSLEQVMVAILHGLEVGLTPMNALQSIAVINGRPTIWGDGALGLIRASGLLEYMKEYFEHEDTPQMKAVCVVKRKGEAEPVTTTFSVIDANKAGLLGKAGPWQTYPKRMLKMRARWALRDTFSDVLKGLHLREEIEDMARSHQAEREPELPLAAAPPPVPSPPPEDETEVVDQTTGEVTSQPAEAVKEDPISSGPIPAPPASDFPGDRPMDIPWAIDRKLSDGDKEWLRELSEEFSACSTIEEISSVAESVMDPAQDAVSTYVWKKACDMLDTHIERVERNNG
jgi:hypothetical protein